MNRKTIADETADPESALGFLEDASRIRPELLSIDENARPLAHLFAGSGFLGNWLIRRPEDIDWLFEDEKLSRRRSVEEMVGHIDKIHASLPDDPVKALRVFKHKELARIAIRELAGSAELVETLLEWSNVADIAIDSAIRVTEKKSREKYGVPIYTEKETDEKKEGYLSAIAMGKLGGGELNISSDVDLIFVHSSDNGTTEGGTGPGLSLHEFFVRTARESAKLLNEVTQDGFVFRVDLDLRPEGRSGEVTNSIGAMEIYYESWGRVWERQALIKGRHSGGSAEVTEEILERLTPFVFRKYLDQRAIEQIADMKSKIDVSLATGKRAKKSKQNIKLGRGGIREIEFVVQTLQLLYGARYPELKVRSTMQALDAAVSLGLLSQPHHNDLQEAYQLFRKIENRVQYHQLLQTHSIPEPGHMLNVLARQLGVTGDDPGGELTEKTEKTRERVRSIFDLFFAHDKEGKSDSFPVSLDDREATAHWLDSLSFDTPGKSAEILDVLRNGRPYKRPSERSEAQFDSFGPELIDCATKTSWPDQVLVGFERFVKARGDRESLYDLLDKNRALLKLLSAIFSNSDYLTSILVRQPDLFDRLVASEPVGKPPDKKEYKRRFLEVLSAEQPALKSMANLNVIKTSESLRLGLRRILNFSDRFEVMEGLTFLADEYVKALAVIASREVEKTTDIIEDAKWTILSGGKLGRREMNYGSDIDMIVVYEGGGEARDFATRLIQNIIRLSKAITPYGAGYDIDLSLRPDGDKGPLVPSLSAISEYYKTRGQAWERLALAGVRPITGDEEFSAEVMETVRRFIQSPPLTESQVKKIAFIRDRIISEKTRPGLINIKLGRGGLIEIEFICQILRMENHQDEYRGWDGGPFTTTVLARATEKGWLEKEEGETLKDAYGLFRSIEDALRMDMQRSVNVTPKKGPELSRLARRIALPGIGPELFTAKLKDTMKSVNAIYTRFMAERSG